MNFVTISTELAYKAYSGISFDPDKRRDSTVKDFNDSLQKDFAELSKLATSERQITVLNEQFEAYQQRYKAMFEAYLRAKSLTISPMITGPARFPVDRNNKRMESERKRWDEFHDWQNKAFKSIVNKIKDARTPEQLQSDTYETNNKAMEYLLEESLSVIACIGGQSPYSPALLKAALERKILNFAKNNPELALRVVNEINLMCQEKFKKDVFTSKHPIVSKIESFKVVKPVENKENEVIFKAEHFEVLNNHLEQRIQFIFDSKPDEQTRNILKSNAFKWAPSQNAWQRQNTPNGMYATKSIINQLIA